MHESVTFGGPVLVLGNLTREDVAERRKRVVHGLVVDRLVQVLDEHVPNAGFSQGRIPLRPHDADGFAFQRIEIHRIECSLG